MLRGQKVLVIGTWRVSPHRTEQHEAEHRISEFGQFLPAGPLEDGSGERKHDLIQFFDCDVAPKAGVYQGRKHTVRADECVLAL